MRYFVAIELPRLLNYNHERLMMSVVDLVAPVAAALNIETAFERLKTACEAEAASLGGPRASHYTAPKMAADRARSHLYGGLVKQVRGQLRHYDPPSQEAARRLMNVFDTYGNVARLGLNAKTSAIYNLLQDLRSESYAPALTRLGLTAWADALEQENQKTAELARLQMDELAERPALTVREARVAADAALRLLLKQLEVMIEIEGEAPYAELTARLNARLAEFAETIARRRGRNTARHDAEKEHDADTPQAADAP